MLGRAGTRSLESATNGGRQSRSIDRPKRDTGRPMTKAEMVEVEGVVIETMPHALYRVELESKERIVAHVLHAPRRNFVRILMGDRVTVAVSTRDRTRGRITQRQL